PLCERFLLYSYVATRLLHSFPTRRSSDLRRLPRPHPLAQGGGGEIPLLRRQPGGHLRHVGGGAERGRGAAVPRRLLQGGGGGVRDRKSTRLNSSHDQISYAVFCLKKKKNL